MRSQRVRHDWETSLSLFTFMHWRRKWQPTPVFLPGESQGREPGGLPSMGSHRVGHDWCDAAAAAAAITPKMLLITLPILVIFYYNSYITPSLGSLLLPCAVLTQLCLTLCENMDCSSPGSSVHGDSPGKNTGVGCHVLLQGIFPTQGSNPDLLHCRQILYHLSHQGSPLLLPFLPLKDLP